MIKKLLRKIFAEDIREIKNELKEIKKIKKELYADLNRLQECLSYFEIGIDVHIKKKSLILILRRDKQEIRFLECPDNEFIESIIRYLKPFQNKVIDAEHTLRRHLYNF